MSPSAVYCIINSPLAQAELARMQAQAKDVVTNVPLRARLSEQLDRTATKSLQTVENILDNPLADVKVRARVSAHILDRVVFDKNDNEKEGSYRDILRKLDEMAGTMMIKPQPVVLEYDPASGDNGHVTEHPAELSLVKHTNGLSITHDEVIE